MKKILGIVLAVALSLLGASCGGASSSSPALSSQSPAVFVTGEDAPLASVVGFEVTITSITLNGNNGSPQVLSTPNTERPGTQVLRRTAKDEVRSSPVKT